MERLQTRLRRHWRETRPWILIGAGVYTFYFGAALLVVVAYYGVDVAASVAGSAAGVLFVLSAGAVAVVTGRWLIDWYQPNFEPGHPRDEYLSSTQLWFDEEQ
ncbi:hypothetical protein [Halosimplex salinum]|uniref:hypothetical protein n=1 Tax=Halosimplex salinum TaxID=1710538 RepID=UPI000F4A34AE|nr:hypothetical protein [Halosimplex salinum]